MKSGAVLLLAYSVACTTASPIAEVVTLELTVRDFAPAYCLTAEARDAFTKGAFNNSGDFSGGDGPNSGWSLTSAECANLPRSYGHPDFEIYKYAGIQQGIVQDTLDFSSPSGIPKPRYCNNVNNADAVEITEFCGASGDFATTHGKDLFDQWYQDTLEINKRIASTITLTRFNNTLSYVFDSEKEAGDFFGPVDDIPASLDPRASNTSWPRSDPENDYSHSFHFTTEIHTYFQYRIGDMFLFSGDDDVFVFINGSLALDLGGVHSAADGDILLDNLGLIENEIYALDMFHAERHISESNFKLTTTLAEACNVINSPPDTLEVVDLAHFDENAQDKFYLRGSSVVGNSLVLTTETGTNRWSHAWLAQQVNVGQGFDATFSYTAPPNSDGVSGEGFSFVLQRAGVTDLQGGVGGYLGLRDLNPSVAVTLDFCTSRNTAVGNDRCKFSTELRLSINGATVASAPMMQVVNDGKEHIIRVRYFARPDWIEVLHDGSLWLRATDFDAISVLGNRNAVVGFAASTSSIASQIQINSLLVSTVGVAKDNTQLVSDLVDYSGNSTAQTLAVADGTDVSQFLIRNFDNCGFNITFGGLGKLVNATIVEVIGTAWKYNNYENWTTPADVPSRRLLDPQSSYYNFNTEPTVRNATIIDNNDGTYAVEISTDVAAEYTLFVSFDGSPVCTVDGKCSPFASAIAFQEYIPPVGTMRPTDVVEIPQGLPQEVVYGIAVAGGVFGCCLFVSTVLFVRSQKEWRDKFAFINAGKLFGLEQDVDYPEAAQIDELQRQLQATMESINRERARGVNNNIDYQHTLQKLEKEKEEISQHLQDMKRRVQDSNIDQLSVFNRPRISFRKRMNFRSARLSNRKSQGLGYPIPESNVQQVSQPPEELPKGNRESTFIDV